jgi:hypothetical protein
MIETVYWPAVPIAVRLVAGSHVDPNTSPQFGPVAGDASAVTFDLK